LRIDSNALDKIPLSGDYHTKKLNLNIQDVKEFVVRNSVDVFWDIANYGICFACSSLATENRIQQIVY
jgi:hypothetical protein